MKAFEVEYYFYSGIQVSNHKTFINKENAEEFYQELYNAINLLGISSYFNAKIFEVEIK